MNSNLPQKVGRFEAFYLSPLEITFVMDGTVDMSNLNFKIPNILGRNELLPEVTISGSSYILKWSIEQTRLLPQYFSVFIILGQSAILEQPIVVQREGNEEAENSNTVEIIVGQPGVDLELDSGDGFIRWKRINESTWENLIPLSQLIGKDGEKGEPGKDGTSTGRWRANWNVAANTPNPNTLTDLQQSDFVRVSVAGTSSITGTAITYQVNDGIVWIDGKWEYVNRNDDYVANMDIETDRDPTRQLLNSENIINGYVHSSGSLSEPSNSNFKTAVISLHDKGTNSQLTFSNQTDDPSGITKYYSFRNNLGAIVGNGAANRPNLTHTVSIPSTSVEVYLTVKILQEAYIPDVIVNYGNTPIDNPEYVEEIVSIRGVSVRNAGKEIYSKSETYSKEEVNEIVPIPEIDVVDENINVYNPAKMLVNGFVNTGSAGVAANADWRMAWRCPIPEGATNVYLFGWESTRREICFFNGELPEDGAVPSGAYNGQWISRFTPTKLNGRATVAVPTGATWLAVTVRAPGESDSLYSQFMISWIEQLSYIPYSESNIAKIVIKMQESDLFSRFIDGGNNSVIKSSDLVSLVQAGNIVVTISQGEEISLEYVFKGKKVRESFAAIRYPNNNNSDIFDWRTFRIDGNLVRSTLDDAAPARALGTTIGANHGYAKSIVTANAHGKTQVDVGSVWTNGTTEFIIVQIVGINQIALISRTGNSYYTGSSLTHVSGATNTGSISTTTIVNGQLLPVISKRSLRCVINDNQEIDLVPGICTAQKVTFIERYFIQGRESIVNWLIARAGNPAEFIQFGGTDFLYHENTHTFTPDMGCVTFSKYVALEDTQLTDLMMVMSGALPAPFNYYIPGSKSFVFQGVTYDFSTPTDITGVTMSSRINFDSAKLKETGLYGDRALMLKDDIGFAVGFLPLADTAIDIRRTLAARKALQISESRKLYMSAIDSAAITVMTKGQSYTAVSYKKYFFPEEGQTASYSIEYKGDVYVFADFHTQTVKTIDIPASAFGLNTTVIEKTDNLNVISSSGSLLIETTNSSPASVLVKYSK